MEDNNMQITNHDFLIYKDSNNDVKVSVMLINGDIWLTQDLIAELFDVGRSTITEHINNILNSGELNEKTSVGISDISSGGRRICQLIWLKRAKLSASGTLLTQPASRSAV